MVGDGRIPFEEETMDVTKAFTRLKINYNTFNS